MIFYGSRFACTWLYHLLEAFTLEILAILASSSEVPSVLEFLQRRKLEAKKVSLQFRNALLRIGIADILGRPPSSMISLLMDILPGKSTREADIQEKEQKESQKQAQGGKGKVKSQAK
ncbi:hypothetical protein Tco_0640024 [Tanacetum coccineum]